MTGLLGKSSSLFQRQAPFIARLFFSLFSHLFLLTTIFMTHFQSRFKL